MGFQKKVATDQGDGTLGEVDFGSPMSAMPAVLASTKASNNVIGRAFQHVSAKDGLVTADAGAAGVFAGLLISPKSYSLQGTSGGTLEPSITMRNNENVELLEMGSMTAYIKTAGNIGDELYYSLKTGELSAQAAGGTAPADHARVPGGFIVRKNVPAPKAPAKEVLAHVKVGVVK
ncbi:hypothetical protein LCS82_13870 [Vibrio harveyi]|uniref:structural cement protein Gp24 n=1 Tax=Vibrio harveyi TaxID=669 RepID=UPI003BB7BDA3